MRAALVVVVVAVLLGVVTPEAFAQDQPPLPNLPNSAEIQLKVERDGALSVIEAISVPAGTTMTRRVPLKVPAPHNRVRVYGVRDVVIEGAGTAETSADEFVVNLRGGTSVIRYTVDGAVDGDSVSWQLAGGWDTELKLVRASFAAPRIPDAVDCLAGPVSPTASDLTCGAAQIDHAGLTRFSQQNLPAGQRMDVTVELPAGTVPGNARLQPAKTLAGAFVLTAPVGWAWGGFGLLALAAAAWLWLARRRAKVVGGPLPTALTSGDGVFTSPEAVLPGHAGLLLSGRADAVDLAATVLDLAVRNYLWVSETAHEHGLPDWRIARRNPADDQLSVLEQAVFAAVLPEGTESVLLSELRSAGVGIDDVRAAFVEDVVLRHWLRRGRNLGVRIVFYGVFLTALLACTVGYAQLGLIVALAGVLLALGGRAIPPRTRQGAALRRRLLGMRAELHRTRARDVPKLERGRLFSRALPYALVLGEAPQWADAFAEPKRPLELYWYEAGEREEGTRRAGEFAAALVGAFAGARPGTSSPGRSILLASSP